MTWFDWFLIGYWAFALVTTVSLVGRPREPLEPRQAAVSVVVVGLLMVGLLVSRGAFA